MNNLREFISSEKKKEREDRREERGEKKTTYVKYFQSDNLANSAISEVPKYMTCDQKNHLANKCKRSLVVLFSFISRSYLFKSLKIYQKNISISFFL